MAPALYCCRLLGHPPHPAAQLPAYLYRPYLIPLQYVVSSITDTGPEIVEDTFK